MQRFYRSVVSALCTLPFLVTTALAASPNNPGVGGGVNPGVRIGEWIQHNVAALFAPLIGLVALYYLMRREFTRFLSFAVFAVLVALFVFAGTDFKEAAVGLARWIIGR